MKDVWTALALSVIFGALAVSLVSAFTALSDWLGPLAALFLVVTPATFASVLIVLIILRRTK